MTTANSNEIKYDYSVGYELEVQTKTVELDCRTVEQLDTLYEDNESCDKLITELASIFAMSELSATRVDSPLTEWRPASLDFPYPRRAKRGVVIQRASDR